MKGKKILSLLLAMFLIAVFLPVTAKAEDDSSQQKALHLVQDGVASNIQGAQASSVYFGGHLKQGVFVPHKWRVLSNAEGKLFLFSENDDFWRLGLKYDNNGGAVTWETCEIRKDLNSMEGARTPVINSLFHAKEISAIAETTVVTQDNENAPGGNDTVDKLFLLSIEEVTNPNYGFSADPDEKDINRAANYNWFLRSPGTDSDYGNNPGEYVSNVNKDGGVDLLGKNPRLPDYLTRPAFNLDLSQVLFTTAAENGKVSADADGTFTGIGAYSGDSWKVTLRDSNRTFSVTEAEVSGYGGDKLTLNFTGAAGYTNSNEYISGIITDASGSPVYYGRLAALSAAEGTFDLTIPDDIGAGSYTLKLFSEQYNGDYCTDYASAFVDVKLTVAKPQYSVSVSASPETGGKVSVNSSEGAATAEALINNGASVTVHAAANEGYAFEGWYVPDTSAPVSTEPDYAFSVASDTLLTAIFSKTISQTVTFAVVNGSWDNGATDPVTVTLTGYEGDKLTLSEDQIPTVGNKPAENYKAGSWDVTPDTTTEIKDNPTYTYSYIEKNKISQTVTFVVVNGSWDNGATDPVTVTLTGYEGDKLTLSKDQIPAAGNKPVENYKAGNWDTTPDTTTEIKGNPTYTYTYAEDKTTAPKKQCVISFDLNGHGNGSLLTITVPEGETTKLPAYQSTAVGYTFIGWATSVDGSGTIIPDQGEITFSGDTALYAQWKANQYTVRFNANSGTGTMASISVQYDEKKTLPANAFTRTGYYFAGWNIAADGSGVNIPDQGQILNLTDVDGATVELYAQWKNVYNVIEGANSKVMQGSGNGLRFKTDGDYSKFTGIRVDGQSTAPSLYTSGPGSTIVELKPEYISTLDVGNHTIEFLYTDGSCTAFFEVLAESGKTETVVVTNDPVRLPLWISLFAISAIGMAALLLVRHKQS